MRCPAPQQVCQMPSRLSRVLLLDGGLKMNVQAEVARNGSVILVSRENQRVSTPKSVVWTRPKLVSMS